MMSLPVRCRIPARFMWFWVAVMSLFAFVFVPVLVAGTLAHAQGPPIWFALVWIAALGFNVYYGLAVVSYEICYWPDDGRVQFRSVLVTKETNLADVTAIRPLGALNATFLKVEFRGGRTRLVRSMDGLVDFITRARAANPAADIHGV